MTPLEKWLSDATRGLSAESAAQVRQEIQEHCDSTSEAGEDAIAALGDPRAANRAYRKVLLTEQEAMLAPTLTRPRRDNLVSTLVASVIMAPVALTYLAKGPSPGFWPVMIAIFCTLPLIRFLPATTLKRSRAHLWLAGAQSAVVAGVVWWYQGWAVAIVVGPIFFLLNYLPAYSRFSILRKLAAGQTYSLLPGEPQLTHLEAIVLKRLRNGDPSEKFAAPVFLIVAGMTVWLPATFVPMTVWIGAVLLAEHTLPIYTEERSRRFRIAKWTTMAIVAALPFLYSARIPWTPIYFLALLFVLFDLGNIALRRKLPAAEWPKRLYW